MNARRRGLLAVLFLALAVCARAIDQADYLNPSWGTQPVAIMGGDTAATYSVTCSSNTLAAGATALRPVVTVNQLTQSSGRPLRSRCFQNLSAFKVNIGSSTVAGADYFTLGESTSTYGVYCTHSSAAVYCAPNATITASGTVVVFEETQSLP